LNKGFDQLPKTNWNRSDRALLNMYFKNKSSDWAKPQLQKTRTRLRQWLISKQRSSCAYCRRLITLEKGRQQIDHILPKGRTGFPKYTYERLNLVATCPHCNEAKSDHIPLKSPKIHLARFPSNGSFYLWVHPYFHRYSDHIRIRDGLLFEAIGTPEHKARAQAVIDKCKLTKLAVLENRFAGQTAVFAKDPLFAAMQVVCSHPALPAVEIVHVLRRYRSEFQGKETLHIVSLIDSLRNGELSKAEQAAKQLGLA
jgi:5-methylcytosine-specific restriction endonuclease McrA